MLARRVGCAAASLTSLVEWGGGPIRRSARPRPLGEILRCSQTPTPGSTRIETNTELNGPPLEYLRALCLGSHRTKTAEEAKVRSA
jgi:hypothetical protein